MKALFPKGREGILDETIKMKSGDIRAMLVKGSYIFDEADVFLSDLGEVDNGRSKTLVSKTYALGVFGAAGTSIDAIVAAVSNAVILFLYTGDDNTARLIAYIGSPANGLPCTPAAGQTLNIDWDTGPNKIFKL